MAAVTCVLTVMAMWSMSATPHRAMGMSVVQVILKILHFGPQAMQRAFHAAKQLMHVANVTMNVAVTMLCIVFDVLHQVFHVMEQFVQSIKLTGHLAQPVVAVSQ